ncbi:hypothetical protein V6N11_051154 [Hibiscus sabdariffa]|uniref:Uncharacterized protein n=1 Tax=Hibiscus sabdariffa TaxID=183260 RepID=A0ABR2R3I8_9ROSI
MHSMLHHIEKLSEIRSVFKFFFLPKPPFPIHLSHRQPVKCFVTASMCASTSRTQSCPLLIAPTSFDRTCQQFRRDQRVVESKIPLVIQSSDVGKGFVGASSFLVRFRDISDRTSLW